MNLSARIFLGYFILAGLGVYVFLNIAVEELKPAVRQSTEDTLIETANLLATMATDDVKAGTVSNGEFVRNIEEFSDRRFGAEIWGITKDKADHRIYITDRDGIVIFDTEHRDVGKDYSQWRDVSLTLRGRYGARSTRTDPDDEASSVMHVAAPIKDGEAILGVLTVAKPNLTVQPFIDRGQRKLVRGAGILLIASLGVGLALSFLFTRSLRRLSQYARDVGQGKRVSLPPVSGRELADLGPAIETMRTELEGKDYVERYVHALTHELKSPLAAIQGASELLEEDMSPAERAQFLANIRNETERSQLIVARMLDQAVVEHRQGLQNIEDIALRDCLNEVLAGKGVLETAKRLVIKNDVPESVVVRGERFLLRQAFSNLLDNAITFTPAGGTVHLAYDHEGGVHHITVRDSGDGIPDYAVDKIFDRFYSLPRPGTGKKSTGLGLSFVREVAQLHGGAITVANHPQGGVLATLHLPSRQ